MAGVGVVVVGNVMRSINNSRLTLSRSVSDISSGIDLHTYPLDKPNSEEYALLVRRGAKMLQYCGCATFPSFMTNTAVSEAASKARQTSLKAFITNDHHNAYQLPGIDESLPMNHPRNLAMKTQVASIAFDEMTDEDPLRKLYSYEGLVAFIGDVVGHKLYRLSDPIGACTVNIFRPGWEHAWHFDESEFTTTLCLQQADGGGHFEYSSPLRESQDNLAVDEVSRILHHHSSYSPLVNDNSKPSAKITTANFEPGTLQIFAGRYSLHRVTAIRPKSYKERLVAVLCFGTQPGVVNSHGVQKMFWGRSSHEVISWS
jgi:hypothetical protein